MIEVSLSLIERDVTKVLPKIRLHWDMRQTVAAVTSLHKKGKTMKMRYISNTSFKIYGNMDKGGINVAYSIIFSKTCYI